MMDGWPNGTPKPSQLTKPKRASTGGQMVLPTQTNSQNRNVHRRVAKRYSQPKTTHKTKTCIDGWPNGTPNPNQLTKPKRASTGGQTVLPTQTNSQNQNVHRRVAKRYSQPKPTHKTKTCIDGWPNGTANSSQLEPSHKVITCIGRWPNGTAKASQLARKPFKCLTQRPRSQ